MTQYWCYVLSDQGRHEARKSLDASNDNEAFGTAQCYLAQNPSVRSVEVWMADRYLGKIHSH